MCTFAVVFEPLYFKNGISARICLIESVLQGSQAVWLPHVNKENVESRKLDLYFWWCYLGPSRPYGHLILRLEGQINLNKKRDGMEPGSLIALCQQVEMPIQKSDMYFCSALRTYQVVCLLIKLSDKVWWIMICRKHNHNNILQKMHLMLQKEAGKTTPDLLHIPLPLAWDYLDNEKVMFQSMSSMVSRTCTDIGQVVFETIKVVWVWFDIPHHMIIWIMQKLWSN